jgi:hypothetical protein
MRANQDRASYASPCQAGCWVIGAAEQLSRVAGLPAIANRADRKHEFVLSGCYLTARVLRENVLADAQHCLAVN